MHALRLLAIAAALAAAAPAQPAIQRYAIYLDDSMFGTWDYTLDPMDAAALHAQFGHEYAWFRQGGARYVVNDAGVLDELRRAVKPQNEVNRMKDERNAEAAAIAQSQMLANLRAQFAERLRQPSGGAPAGDSGQAELRARIRDRQQKLDALQQQIDAAQKSVSADTGSRVSAILESAVERGLAQRLN